MWAALLGFGAIVALLISWPIKRARFWVALIMAGYFIPRYWDIAGLGHIYMLNLLVDAFICLVIDRYAREKWEVLMFKVYKLSAATSALFFAGYIATSYFSAPSTFGGIYFEVYGILLEGFNWTALAIITHTGWVEWNGRLTSALHRRSYNQTARQAIRAPRASSSWQHK